MFHCPKCGRFVKEISIFANGLDEIVKVEGVCKKHGIVDVTNQDWDYDDFDNYFSLKTNLKYQ